MDVEILSYKDDLIEDDFGIQTSYFLASKGGLEMLPTCSERAQLSWDCPVWGNGPGSLLEIPTVDLTEGLSTKLMHVT